MGNTYHTVRVIVDGEWIYSSPRSYGYGSQYAWTAREWLRQNGYLPEIEGESLSTYCHVHGIAFIDECIDVPRKKDL